MSVPSSSFPLAVDPEMSLLISTSPSFVFRQDSCVYKRLHTLFHFLCVPAKEGRKEKGKRKPRLFIMGGFFLVERKEEKRTTNDTHGLKRRELHYFIHNVLDKRENYHYTYSVLKTWETALDAHWGRGS